MAKLLLHGVFVAEHSVSLDELIMRFRIWPAYCHMLILRVDSQLESKQLQLILVYGKTNTWNK